MRLNKSFAMGLAIGILITIIAGIGSLVWISHKVNQSSRTDLFIPVAGIPEPPFPDISQVHIYGSPDSEWEFRSLDGKPTRLSDFRGRVIFLHFWATWCGSCRDELPYLQSLQDRTRGLPIAFVLLSQEDPSKVKKFLNSFHQSSLPTYVATEKSPSVFQILELPSTFIIDKEGRVVFRYFGYAPWGDKSVKFLSELADVSVRKNVQ